MDEQRIDRIGETLANIHTLLQTAEKQLYELEGVWVTAVRESQKTESK